MEKQTIKKKINYVNEAYLLMRRLCEEEDAEKLQKRLEKKHAGLRSVRARRKFAFVQEIEREAAKRFADRKEEVHFYFGTQYSGGECVGGMVLLLDEASPEIPNLKEQRSYLEALSEEDFCKEFGEKIKDYRGIIGEDDEENNLEQPLDIMRFILGLDIEEKEKWRLQQVFIEPKRHREKVFDLLADAVDLLKEHKAQMKEMIEWFVEDWNKVLAAGDFKEFLKKNVGVTIDENEYGLVINPSFIGLNSISVIADAEGGKITTPYSVHLGILFDEDFSLQMALESGGDENSAENVQKVLKLLSDKSKFEILMSIKDEKAYGSELAKKLNLTTATISHHMSALVAAGLIQIEKEDTKVYYSAKKEEIRKVLEYCMEVLAD